MSPDHYETAPRESNYEEPVSLRDQIRALSSNPSRPQGAEPRGGDDNDDPAYADIMERRQSDYVNVDLLANIDTDSDDDDNEGGVATGSGDEGGGGGGTKTTTGHALRGGGSGYLPSVKLHSHPALKKSQSHSESADGTSSIAELLRVAASGATSAAAAAKKPKNRAPPPPPGKDEGGGAARGLSPMANRHQRSQSDVNSASGNSGGQRSSAVGQRSPIAERRVVAQNQNPRAQGQSSSASSSHDQRSQVQGQRAPKAPQSSHIKVPSSSTSRATPTSAQSRPHPPTSAASATPAGGSEVVRAKPKASIPNRPPPPSGPAPLLPAGHTPSGHAHAPSGHAHKDRGGVARGGQQQQPLQSRHINALGEDKVATHPVTHPPPPPPPPPSDGRSHDRSHDTSRDHQVQSPSGGGATGGNTTPTSKPKRHAPPPPAAGGGVRRTPNSSPEVPRRSEPQPPTYSQVMKGLRLNQPSSLAMGGSAAPPGGEASGRGSRSGRRSAPPKPQHLSRARSLEGLSEHLDPQVSRYSVTEELSLGEAVLFLSSTGNYHWAWAELAVFLALPTQLATLPVRTKLPT